MARNLIAVAATLALFLHVPAAWGDEPEDSASSGMLTIHGVIDAMTAEAALVTEGECQPREDFESLAALIVKPLAPFCDVPLT